MNWRHTFLAAQTAARSCNICKVFAMDWRKEPPAFAEQCQHHGLPLALESNRLLPRPCGGRWWAMQFWRPFELVGATWRFCDGQQSSTLATMFFDHRACVLVLS